MIHVGELVVGIIELTKIQQARCSMGWVSDT